MALTKQQLEAVQLLVDDRMADKAIAVRLGVDVRTIARWKKAPEFVEALAGTRDEVYLAARKHFLGKAAGRIAYKLERHRRYAQIIEERAAAAEGSGVPGATTGLLIKHIKLGKDCIHEEYTVDTAISREMALLEDEVAKEVKEAGPVPPDKLPPHYAGLSPDDLETLDNIIQKLKILNQIPLDQRKRYVETDEERRERLQRKWRKIKEDLAEKNRKQEEEEKMKARLLDPSNAEKTDI